MSRMLPDGVPPRTPESLDGVHFGWAVRWMQANRTITASMGPDLLVELRQHTAQCQSAHSVWRRPDSDFGFDVLAAHRTNHALIRRGSPTAAVVFSYTL